MLKNPNRYYPSIKGVLESLSNDMSAGYMKSITEIIHGDLFSDFLEMADHLNESGYKDPAAVIAGAALESHLRKLPLKFEIPIEKGGKYLKADRISAELKNNDIYNALGHKNVIGLAGS